VFGLGRSEAEELLAKVGQDPESQTHVWFYCKIQLGMTTVHVVTYT
jgi:hypothetical protein